MTAVRPRTEASAAAQASLSFLRDLLAGFSPRDFAVRLWDGTVWEPEGGAEPRFTLVLNHPGALRAMFSPPGELTLAEAYLRADYDVEGDLQAVFPLADHLLVERDWRAVERVRLARRLRALPSTGQGHPGEPARVRGRRFSLERDRQAVTYHYDRSNEFFALFLDPRMVYSCAYFLERSDSIEVAQERKLDYLCRKLRLQPGERLLDIGCGWGGLVVHAAERYGCEAIGITLSARQAEVARARIDERGLGGRCRIEVRDYRELHDPGGFDKLVSVGMVEHVGRAILPDYFRSAAKLLRPGGVFLNHGIGRPLNQPVRRGPSFLQAYVFPDGELVPIGAMLDAAETAGFEVRDVESLREHYALTLDRWIERLEAQRDEAVAAVGEVGYRVFRLYLHGSRHGFETARVTLYQSLLVKPDRGASGLPLTRSDWYAG